MRNRYILLADFPLIAIAVFGAFALRFDWVFARVLPAFVIFLVGALLFKPAIFYIFGMYTRYWRYATASDLLSVVLAVSAGSVVMAAYVGVGRALGLINNFSRSVIAIDWLLSMALIGGLRMSVRVIGEAHEKNRRARSGAAQTKRVLVVGAGEAGTMVVREMQRNPQLNMTPVGFLDDDAPKLGKRIYGTRVMGDISSLERIAQTAGIEEVVIAMPRASGTAVRAVAERCQKLGLRCRTMPGVYELLGGSVSISRLRTVEITDLLRRSHLVDDRRLQEAAAYVRGATVLVTGAGGSIGAELCRQVAHAQPGRLVLVGHGENSIFDIEHQVRREFPDVRVSSVIADVRDERRIDSVFEQCQPHVVLHAAAHKHVPLMEENPVEAITNNVFGTHTIATAALRHGTRRVVLISTDKAVAPTSIMGGSKRVAEMAVQDLAGRGSTAFIVVRFGNVLGSRGSVVPVFKAQIERGGPVTVTHPDMKRFFMTIPEAVNLVLRAGGLGTGGELFVLNMGLPVRIRDLAEDLIKLSGFALSEIPIVYTALRPGEKLEEALWEHGAHVEPTSEPDILCVSERTASTEASFGQILQRLRTAVEVGDRLSIRAALADAIPTFVPDLGDAGGLSQSISLRSN
jgi:FlaA1/EpsC-like NDP-sugar epimerase